MKKSCFRIKPHIHTSFLRKELFILLLFFAVISVIIPHPKLTRAQTPITPTPVIKNGDVNNDGIVNFADVELIISQWHMKNSSSADQYEDGYINSFDFSVTAKYILDK